MTSSTLTKLVLLVLIAFLICIPEFFNIHTVSKVNFLCHPYQPCIQSLQIQEEGNKKPGSAEDKIKDICEPFPTPDHEKWIQICEEKNKNSLTVSEPKTWEVQDDPEKSWFMCEADKNMDELHNNITASGLETHLHMSVKLQLNISEMLNLTFYSHSNHSSLHLHLPEKNQTGDGGGQGDAFYCCLPLHPTSKPANQSLCLLWIANQTVLTETAEEKLPWKRTDKDEQWCVFRVIWLILLCVVLLIVFLAVIGQIFWEEIFNKKPKVPFYSYRLKGQKFTEHQKQTEVVTSTGTTHQSHRHQLLSRLPPIQEVDSEATLLDGSDGHSYTGILHHRGHSPTTVSPEEQAW